MALQLKMEREPGRLKEYSSLSVTIEQPEFPLILEASMYFEKMKLLDVDVRDDDDDESAKQSEILNESEDNLDVEEHQLTDSENEENITMAVFLSFD
ncbi:hypothetical protein HHI36_001693 [Cryptolaemus montrouzieri]|uniref:Uncharacterized protein n=1 Tax=Cryptolaemus montrouzieri TaxID=559131 RepID=A0ABD2P926_9CUCU